MNLTVIAAELFAAGVLPPGELVITPLTGGTSSEVYILHCGREDKLVLKMNEPRTIAAEADYLRRYGHLELLPTFLYVHPENRFLVYNYIEGTTAYQQGKKLELMTALSQRIIARYDQVPWTSGTYPRWQDYLVAEIEDARRNSGTIFTAAEHRMIRELAEKEERVTGPYCKLHGDFGVHNFIFDQGHLAGVIDPIPLVGQPVYELAFAFVSSVDDLEPAIIASVVRQKEWPFTKDLKTIYEDILIALYNRIVRCTFHHPKDLSAYMEAWKDWKLFVNSKNVNP